MTTQEKCQVPLFKDYNITVLTEERWNEIIAAVQKEAPQEFLDIISKMESQELICFHTSAGRHIRNTYGLWELKHEPELIDGIDISPNHPDNISGIILQHIRLLEIAKNENKLLQ